MTLGPAISIIVMAFVRAAVPGVSWSMAIPLSIVGTALGGLALDRLTDLNFKRYLRLILTMIGALYLAEAARLFWLGQ